MCHSTGLFVVLALLSTAPIQAQSLAELAKKEKERRSKVEKTDKPVRTIDENGLSNYRKSDGEPPPNVEAAGVDTAGSDWPDRRAPSENPNRRRSPSNAASTAAQPTVKEPTRDPTLGPRYIEDHLYGEENLKRLRREASECRVKERASSARCKDLERQAAELQKLLRERRRIH